MKNLYVLKILSVPILADHHMYTLDYILYYDLSQYELRN